MPAATTIFPVLITGFILLFSVEAFTYRKKSRSLDEIFFHQGNLYLLSFKYLLLSIALGTIGLWYTLQENVDTLCLPTGTNEWFVVWSCLFITAAGIGFFNKIFSSRHSVPAFLSSSRSAAYYLLSRTLFLIVYEFFFRGMMLEIMIMLAGIEVAILFNIIFYTLAHAFSNRNELIGTIPFGYLLCLITIKLHSVWPAVSIHLALALSYEIKLLYQQRSFTKIISL